MVQITGILYPCETLASYFHALAWRVDQSMGVLCVSVAEGEGNMTKCVQVYKCEYLCPSLSNQKKNVKLQEKKEEWETNLKGHILKYW